MKRFEPFNNNYENKEAGVDLLEKLYKDYGFTAQTLIYCGH